MDNNSVAALRGVLSRWPITLRFASEGDAFSVVCADASAPIPRTDVALTTSAVRPDCCTSRLPLPRDSLGMQMLKGLYADLAALKGGDAFGRGPRGR
jgi:hypothetical protein